MPDAATRGSGGGKSAAATRGSGKGYDADAIQTLEGLEAVRKRPGMYIGGTGSQGLMHLVWELLDNAVDEAAAGFADRIDITLHRDNSVEVADNGALSPCTAGEGHTWGKTTAECVETSSAYLRSDVTVVLPLLTHALLGSLATGRSSKRLMDRLAKAEDLIREEFKRIFSGPNPPLYTGY